MSAAQGVVSVQVVLCLVVVMVEAAVEAAVQQQDTILVELVEESPGQQGVVPVQGVVCLVVVMVVLQALCIPGH